MGLTLKGGDKEQKKKLSRCGPVVKNPPCNAKDTGSIHSWGRSPMLTGQLSLSTQSLCSATREVAAMRSPQATTKTQHSQNKYNLKKKNRRRTWPTPSRVGSPGAGGALPRVGTSQVQKIHIGSKGVRLGAWPNRAKARVATGPSEAPPGGEKESGTASGPWPLQPGQRCQTPPQTLAGFTTPHLKRHRHTTQPPTWTSMWLWTPVSAPRLDTDLSTPVWTCAITPTCGPSQWTPSNPRRAVPATPLWFPGTHGHTRPARHRHTQTHPRPAAGSQILAQTPRPRPPRPPGPLGPAPPLTRSHMGSTSVRFVLRHTPSAPHTHTHTHAPTHVGVQPGLSATAVHDTM